MAKSVEVAYVSKWLNLLLRAVMLFSSYSWTARLIAGDLFLNIKFFKNLEIMMTN